MATNDFSTIPTAPLLESTTNPPPLNVAYQCTYCNGVDSEPMISCAHCHIVCHRKCAGVSYTETTAPWLCKNCLIEPSSGADNALLFMAMTDPTPIIPPIPLIHFPGPSSDETPKVSDNITDVGIGSGTRVDDVITNAPQPTGFLDQTVTGTDPLPGTVDVDHGGDCGCCGDDCGGGCCGCGDDGGGDCCGCGDNNAGCDGGDCDCGGCDCDCGECSIQ